MIAYTVVADPRRNRVYVTGDTSAISDLLSDMRAQAESVPADPHPCDLCHETGKRVWGTDCHRCDGSGVSCTAVVYWLASHRTTALRAALATEEAYQVERAAERAVWEAAKSVIPADYRTRHGAALGGVVTIDDESISEPAMDSHNLPWECVATYERRVRDLTGQSSINGRVMYSDTLYTCGMADGRAAYRIAHYDRFGDDLRETYYIPEDVWIRLMAAEVQIRGITRESATEWLAQSRGCVGTELYEFAATAAQSLIEPPPGTLSVRREIGAGT